ncbi:alpha/beta hydrolase [Mycobacterium kubicae]|uniref:Alpha/beta fold hydrolase n=1 Tax=Mycobacterium kubicae TaxID=120959 RepID=A0AAX1JEZ0_9MYCO|nr:alpha/beta fold hydrolase [Mycobacterium kubicae]MCV7097143.1 alpha/beta fold hydrolase [Mycobacterium kubicae]ORW03136.1 hypothetical protein AWC13_02810 [Mycobacterium kubicae]QNI11548.1 alpha/beta fold hydrolase [Mycobacterium kubicae]QPI39767.1 alpha/beta fold hydrolase [Mycobacterium kubicae]
MKRHVPRLEVIERGQLSSEHPHPLLLVHGAFHGAWCWNAHFVDFFATRGFHVVAPSLRGHGSSQRDGPLRLRSIADFVADVAQIANSLAREPILVGHSMGGFIVQKYLESHSAPAGVLLASAPPRGHLRTLLRSLRQHPWCSVKFGITGRPEHLSGSVAGARELFFGPQTSADLVGAITARLQPESTRALLFDMVAHGLVKTSRISTPMLVLGGAHDALYPESDIVATAAAYGTHATVIADIGHEMMLEPPWAIGADHIHRWLAQRGL